LPTERAASEDRQNAVWSRLLRHIPATQHDSLVLVTANKTEVFVQHFIRIDEAFVAVKGRLAATQ
jgi:hypothetical protein